MPIASSPWQGFEAGGPRGKDARVARGLTGHVEQLLPVESTGAPRLVSCFHQALAEKPKSVSCLTLKPEPGEFGFCRAAQAALSRSAGKASLKGGPLWLALAACDP